jgi:GlpG protein
MSSTTVVLMIGWFFLCLTGWLGSIANMAHTVGLLLGLLIGVAPHVWRSLRRRA